MRPGRKLSPSCTKWVEREPYQFKISGRRLGLAPTCMTTATAAPQLGGKLSVMTRRAASPPADAPIMTTGKCSIYASHHPCPPSDRPTTFSLRFRCEPAAAHEHDSSSRIRATIQFQRGAPEPRPDLRHRRRRCLLDGRSPFQGPGICHGNGAWPASHRGYSRLRSGATASRSRCSRRRIIPRGGRCVDFERGHHRR